MGILRRSSDTDIANAAYRHSYICTKLVGSQGNFPLNQDNTKTTFPYLKGLLISFGSQGFPASARQFPALRQLKACLGTDMTSILPVTSQLTSLSLKFDFQSSEHFTHLRSALALGELLMDLELCLNFSDNCAKEVLGANTTTTTMRFSRLRFLALAIVLGPYDVKFSCPIRRPGVRFQALASLVRSFSLPQLQSLTIAFRDIIYDEIPENCTWNTMFPSERNYSLLRDLTVMSGQVYNNDTDTENSSKLYLCLLRHLPQVQLLRVELNRGAIYKPSIDEFAWPGRVELAQLRELTVFGCNVVRGRLEHFYKSIFDQEEVNLQRISVPNDSDYQEPANPDEFGTLSEDEAWREGFHHGILSCWLESGEANDVSKWTRTSFFRTNLQNGPCIQFE